jgi:hypothetical protein
VRIKKDGCGNKNVFCFSNKKIILERRMTFGGFKSPYDPCIFVAAKSIAFSETDFLFECLERGGGRAFENPSPGGADDFLEGTRA